MSSLVRKGVLAAVLSLVAVLSPQVAGARPAEEQAEARKLSKAKEHFSIGVELLDEAPPNYHDALIQFRRAYELSGSWKVLGNMGLCAHKLERDGEAANHYRAYLREGGTQVNAAERRDIRRDLLAITAGLARVKLSADVAEANVTVNRRESSAASQSYELAGSRVSLGLRAGTYRIVVRTKQKKREWSVVLRPKETAKHHFTFKTSDGVGVTGNQQADTPPVRGSASDEFADLDSESSVLTTPVIVSGAATLVLGGLFAVSGVIYLDQKSALEQDGDPDARSNAETWGFVNIGAAGGALIAAGLTTYFLASGASEGEAQAATLSPWIGPGVVGASLGGKF